MYNRDFKTGLLLNIDMNNCIVPEYQREIYLASLIGIRDIKFLFLIQKEDMLNEELYLKIDEIKDILSETIDKLNMRLCDTFTYLYDFDSTKSCVVKLDSLGRLRSSLKGYEDFDSYKKHNNDKLRKRKRISKVLCNIGNGEENNE